MGQKGMTAMAKSGGAPSKIGSEGLDESIMGDAVDVELPGVTVMEVKRARLVGTLSNWYLMIRGWLALDNKGLVEGMNWRESNTVRNSYKLPLPSSSMPLSLDELHRGWEKFVT